MPQVGLGLCVMHCPLLVKLMKQFLDAFKLPSTGIVFKVSLIHVVAASVKTVTTSNHL